MNTTCAAGSLRCDNVVDSFRQATHAMHAAVDEVHLEKARKLTRQFFKKNGLTLLINGAQ